MTEKDLKLKIITECFHREKVLSLDGISKQINNSQRTIQRYLLQLNAVTSYTHRGKYVTLVQIPKFDVNGLWFFSNIGFSKFGTSLQTIVALINQSEKGITQYELEHILKIRIPRQMQILLQKDELYRVKLNNTYLYMPKEISNDRKKRIRIIASRKQEHYHNEHISLSDVIVVLKVVLQETEIDMDHLKKLIDKHELKIPVSKLEKIIINHDLDKKKRH